MHIFVLFAYPLALFLNSGKTAIINNFQQNTKEQTNLT